MTQPTILLLLHIFVAMVTFFTEPLPSNIHIQTPRLIGGIYEVHHSDGLGCHDIHTEFHKDWFRHSKIDKGGFTDTHSMVIS
jgi:hypothetical protein